MTSTRVWDDPDIPPEELFLRTVPRKPTFFLPNLGTGRFEVKPAALRFEDDGMSVSASRILANEGLDRSELCADWEHQTSVEFPAAAARSSGDAGVVYDPVNGHPRGDVFGDAHSLVRTESESPPREVRRNIQTAIAAQCRWVDEDPHKPEAEQPST